MDYVCGLDLGQAQDYTALAVLERTVRPRPDDATRQVRHYAVRHLERWPLGTPYTKVVADLKALAARPPLSGSLLCLDATGCGRPVVDMVIQARLSMPVVGIVIHGGHATSQDVETGFYHVPKRDLVGILMALVQSERFQIAPALRMAAVLGKELLAFRAKINIATGNETFESWRERDHDDMVLGVALACWYGERYQLGAGVQGSEGYSSGWSIAGAPDDGWGGKVPWDHGDADDPYQPSAWNGP